MAWLADRRSEREKRAEERFQSAITGLGDEKEGPKIGAAVLLRTFLRPGYEQFYTQTFDLAVANLRLPRTTHPSEDPDGLSHSPEDLKTPLPLTTLSQALIVVFKEALPLARKQSKGSPQSLDATAVQLDDAYLSEADLRQAWMPRAFLRAATLKEANLSEAQLDGADLSRAWLIKTSLHKTNLNEVNLSLANLAHADLSDANLKYANLSSTNLQHAKLNGADLRNVHFDSTNLRNADLRNANLSRTNLSRNDLRNADLSGAQLNGADLSDSAIEDTPSLKNADLRKAKGLTKEQLEICKAKGALIEEDSAIIQSQSTTPLPQSNDVQTRSATAAHEG